MSNVARAAFFFLLVSVFLQHLEVPDGINSYHLNLAYLGFGLVAFLYWGYRRGFDDVAPFVGHGLVATALIGVVLSLLTTQEQFILEDHQLKVGVIYLLFLAYPLAQHDPVRFLRSAGAYYVAFALFLGAYFVHIFVGPGVYPIVMGLVVAANLFVVPRYVTRESFFAVVSWIAGAVAAAGLGAYVVGEYSVLSFEITLWRDTFAPPFVDAQILMLQSVFQNPNSAGVVLFAGTVTSLVRTVEGYARRTPRAVLSGGLLVLNAVGLALTYSRASFLAAAVAVALYLSYAALGRRSIPYAFAALVALTVGFLAAIYTGALGASSAGRFALWAGGVRAIAADPSVFGAGLVRPDDVIEPYVAGRHSGASPHNSYVMIFIRTGLLGGFAYLALTVGSVLAGVIDRYEVDPAALALATGFALHQMFEMYSLFQTLVPSVLAALAVGYLVTRGSSVAEGATAASAGADRGATPAAGDRGRTGE